MTKTIHSFSIARPVFDLLVCLPVFVILSKQNTLSMSSYLIFAVTYIVMNRLVKSNISSWRFFSLEDCLKVQLSIFVSLIPMLLIQQNFVTYIMLGSSFTIACLSSRGARKLYHSLSNNEKSGKVLIVGGKNQVNLARSLSEKGADVVGFIDNKDIGLVKSSFPVIAPLNRLHAIIHDYDVDTVAVSEEIRGEELKLVLQECQNAKVQVKRYSYEFSEKSWRLNDFGLHELLGRDRVQVSLDELNCDLNAKTVLVTGAGGSIGSEVCRQLINYNIERLILLDSSEYNLFSIKKELLEKYPRGKVITACMTDVKDTQSLEKVFENYAPDRVYHAAAYKHVHLVEENPHSAILNNVLGTKNLLYLSKKYDVENFLLVSTDKAVNPTSVMGATKRVCELMVSKASLNSDDNKYCSVRFGNVLGSSGSLIPILKDQILKGGPLTITDPEMRRFFMSIPEAVSLVLKSALISNNGAVNILKMGEEIRIIDIAKKLISLSGFNEEEMPIVFTGKKPGEKLYEELYLCGNEIETTHSEIMTLPHGDCLNLFASEKSCFEFDKKLYQLIEMAKEQDSSALSLLQGLINKSNREVNIDNSFKVELGGHA